MENLEMKEFIHKNCANCKEKCDKGIVQTKRFIRCIDKNITQNRKTIEKNDII